MNRYNNLKASAHVLQALGLIAFVGSLIIAPFTAAPYGVVFAVSGFITFVWLFAIGAALLALADVAQSQADIAKSTRASAVIAVEQDERRKAKLESASKGKSLNLQRISPKKRQSA